MCTAAPFEHARDGVTGAEQEPAEVHRDGAVEHREVDVDRVGVTA